MVSGELPRPAELEGHCAVLMTLALRPKGKHPFEPEEFLAVQWARDHCAWSIGIKSSWADVAAELLNCLAEMYPEG